MDDVGGRPALRVGAQEALCALEVLTEREGRELDVPVAPVLGQADVGRQGVAQAGASEGGVEGAALAQVRVGRLGRAAVAQGPVRALEGFAQVRQVAQARTGGET